MHLELINLNNLCLTQEDTTPTPPVQARSSRPAPVFGCQSIITNLIITTIKRAALSTTTKRNCGADMYHTRCTRVKYSWDL